MPCDFNYHFPEDNSSLFLPQAMATVCWKGSMGGGILNGQDSLLTCTASDTCALDALASDGIADKLIYCGSCPSSYTTGAFSCNTYLRRCTCGASHVTPQASLSLKL